MTSPTHAQPWYWHCRINGGLVVHKEWFQLTAQYQWCEMLENVFMISFLNKFRVTRVNLLSHGHLFILVNGVFMFFPWKKCLDFERNAIKCGALKFFCRIKRDVENVNWHNGKHAITSRARSVSTMTLLVTGESPAQRPVTRSFDVFFDLLLNQTMETPMI